MECMMPGVVCNRQTRTEYELISILAVNCVEPGCLALVGEPIRGPPQ